MDTDDQNPEYDGFMQSFRPIPQIAEDRGMGDGFSASANFKALVEQHKATGWINLAEDKKQFVCMFIRDGFTTQGMLTRGCSEQEAESYSRDPLVQAAIADVSEAYSVVNTFSTVGWRAKLTRALDMALGDTPMVTSIKGKQIMVRVVDLPSAVRLLDLAAKYKDLKDDPKDSQYERFAKLPWEKRE